jgi:membrane associated rhomboid family serine protease
MVISDLPQAGINPADNDTPLAITGSAEYLETCSLVLNAVNIPHSFDPNQFTLTVPAPYSDYARQQLEQYFEENSDWPEKPVPAQIPLPNENPPTLLMIGGLAIFFLVTGSWQDHVFWFRAGAIDSPAILEQGEWWRLVTALTLHADQVHLVGNCVIGGFLVHLLCKSIGSGLGWFLLITCGILGNLFNILLRDQAHHSVGFSTSIFAAIGLFSGLQLLIGTRMRLKKLLVPLGAGVALLAMLGSEGERTDLGAHFFGFACGLVFGFLLNRLNIHKLAGNAQLQRKLFMFTLFVILASWIVAGQ